MDDELLDDDALAPRNARMDDEFGAEGVEPEEHEREKASAHSYRRYVGCIFLL